MYVSLCTITIARCTHNFSFHFVNTKYRVSNIKCIWNRKFWCVVTYSIFHLSSVNKYIYSYFCVNAIQLQLPFFLGRSLGFLYEAFFFTHSSLYSFSSCIRSELTHTSIYYTHTVNRLIELYKCTYTRWACACMKNSINLYKLHSIEYERENEKSSQQRQQQHITAQHSTAHLARMES